MRTFKCTFIGFTNAAGDPVEIVSNHEKVRAKVLMKEDHDKRGGREGEITFTSAVRYVDFDKRHIVTQNNIYDFSP